MSSDETPVRVTYSVDGCEEVTEAFALLVVACDPRQLAIADPTPLEEEVKKCLSSYTFHTSLMKADREGGSMYAGKFHPENLDIGKANVYAMRDEVRSHILDLDAREVQREKGGETLVTVYQLDTKGVPLPIGGDEAKADRARFERLRDEQLAAPEWGWLGFKPRDEEPVQTLYEDYFPHFEKCALVDGLPWKVLDAQGERNTIYVSSFTCFESALHCYEYAELLMQSGSVNRALPRDLDAPIAVVGAGVSGIMFATLQLIRQRGYTNVKLLEREDRHGGKSRTVTRKSPYNPDEDIPCELGTCYLSPAYDKMIYLLDEYDAGVKIPLSGDDERPFRAVVDPKHARGHEEHRDGVEFEEWVKRTNGKFGWLLLRLATDVTSQIDLLVALLKYKAIHTTVMGLTRPLPKRMPKPPPDMKEDDPLYDAFDAALTHTFGDFLDRFGVGAVRGLFTYMYEVQGYGDIEKIPAYYGMVWMTTEVVDGVINSKLPKTREPDAVFAFSKGWLTLWDNIVKKEKLNIVKNVTISSITRC